eukprot:jgi/Ulvmu1/9024/UM005_0115.1
MPSSWMFSLPRFVGAGSLLVGKLHFLPNFAAVCLLVATWAVLELGALGLARPLNAHFDGSHPVAVRGYALLDLYTVHMAGPTALSRAPTSMHASEQGIFAWWPVGF